MLVTAYVENLSTMLATFENKSRTVKKEKIYLKIT
jgi:hypothetical protein